MKIGSDTHNGANLKITKMAKSLVSAVTNILHKRVTEEEAKDFALNQFGLLASYIRNEFIENLKKQENENTKKKKA